jgi:F0F1-type ATP synthase assembly protein I
VEQPDSLIPAGLDGGEEKETQERERAETRAALSHGARGAILIAGIAVGLLFIGWLLFYFVLFMRRGYVG